MQVCRLSWVVKCFWNIFFRRRSAYGFWTAIPSENTTSSKNLLRAATKTKSSCSTANAICKSWKTWYAFGLRWVRKMWNFIALWLHPHHSRTDFHHLSILLWTHNNKGDSRKKWSVIERVVLRLLFKFPRRCLALLSNLSRVSWKICFLKTYFIEK